MPRYQNEERNALILSLYDKGLTFGQIADKTETTRNIVAGVVHRSGAANRGGQKLPYDDLSGKRFGSLTVLERGANAKGGSHRYYCICDCGQRRLIQAESLRYGNTKSCGCQRAQSIGAAMTKYRQNDPICKDAVKLREKGWQYKEIAQALEIKPSTAWYIVRKSRLSATA